MGLLSSDYFFFIHKADMGYLDKSPELKKRQGFHSQLRCHSEMLCSHTGHREWPALAPAHLCPTMTVVVPRNRSSHMEKRAGASPTCTASPLQTSSATTLTSLTFCSEWTPLCVLRERGWGRAPPAQVHRVRPGREEAALPGSMPPAREPCPGARPNPGPVCREQQTPF